nr:RHS repeat-associated core domain-containing protein [uncultured Chryseobacterium sp.]
MSTNNYYPFGLNHIGGSNASSFGSFHSYKYNGKELQETGFYDYGWRQYMPDIARWNGMDVLSEKFISTSPYAYVANNPISFIDPDGMDIKPTSGGWEFTGNDINTIVDYLSGGGSVKKMTNALSSWQDGGAEGNFWSFLGSYNSWGGSGDAGGSIFGTFTSDGALGTSQNQIQEIVFTKVKLGSAVSDWYTEQEFQKSVRQPGRAMMMGGFLDFFGFGDIIGSGIENYLNQEDQERIFLAGVLAAVALKKPGLITKTEGNIWKIGAYKEMRGLEAGLDAHHVGQSAVMKKLVAGYDHKLAPTILVPKLGHTIGTGVVSRSTAGFTSARQVVARDIMELRRVYGGQGIPNSALQELIQMNKTMYPNAFIK